MTIHFSHVPATFRNCPRVGSTSFKFWCYRNIPNCEVVLDQAVTGLLHMDMTEIQARWANPGVTFAFVRNPYDRLVSIFHFIGQKAKYRLDNKIPSPYGNGTTEEDLRLFFFYQKGFAHWIKNRPTIIQQPKDYTNMAFFNDPGQTQMHCFNHVVPDLIFKLENIKADFPKIQELLQCNKQFTHRNSTSHTSYRDYYTDETRAIATKFIEEDLDTFGYTF